MVSLTCTNFPSFYFSLFYPHHWYARMVEVYEERKRSLKGGNRTLKSHCKSNAFLKYNEFHWKEKEREDEQKLTSKNEPITKLKPILLRP